MIDASINNAYINLFGGDALSSPSFLRWRNLCRGQNVSVWRVHDERADIRRAPHACGRRKIVAGAHLGPWWWSKWHGKESQRLPGVELLNIRQRRTGSERLMGGKDGLRTSSTRGMRFMSWILQPEEDLRQTRHKNISIIQQVWSNNSGRRQKLLHSGHRRACIHNGRG